METTILTPDGYEKGLLNALMWRETDDFLEITSGLTAECFYNEERGDLFDVLKTRYLKQLPLTDMEMVAKDMVERGHKNFTVIDIMCLSDNVSSVMDTREYVISIIELHQRRMLNNLFVELQNKVNDRSQDLPTVVSKAIDLMMSGMNLNDEQITVLSDVLNDTRQRMDDNRNGVVRAGFKTGFSRLDRYGGLHPSDLVIIAADSSQGKTALAINILVNAVRESEAKAVVYSMEMSAMQLGARILSPETNLPASVITYRALTDNSYNEALEGIQGLSPISDDIFFGDSSAQTVSDILSSIRLHHARFGVNIVVVDYLQIIAHEQRWSGKTEEALADAARRLKNLAKELNIVVMLLSQINRDGANMGFNIPSASRLRGSGQINEAADLTLLIYRPEVYGATTYPSPHQDVPVHGTAMLKIDKDRFGAYGGIGSFIVDFNGSTTKFGEKPPSNSPEGEKISPLTHP